MARLYQETRERITPLVTRLDDAACSIAIATCPGWSVRNVVAHLTRFNRDHEIGQITAMIDREDTVLGREPSGYGDNPV